MLPERKKQINPFLKFASKDSGLEENRDPEVSWISGIFKDSMKAILNICFVPFKENTIVRSLSW